MRTHSLQFHVRASGNVRVTYIDDSNATADHLFDFPASEWARVLKQWAPSDYLSAVFVTVDDVLMSKTMPAIAEVLRQAMRDWDYATEAQRLEALETAALSAQKARA